jgi:general secretion pathway protein L
MNAIFYIDPEGNAIHLNAAELQQHYNEDEIEHIPATAWVSTNKITLTTVTWPHKRLNLHKKQALLPFLLEESILDEIDDVHFALHDNPDLSGAIAVLTNKIIKEWQQIIANIYPGTLVQLVPDIFALPMHENKWSIWHEGDNTLVRTAIYGGFSGKTNWIYSILSLLLKENSEQEIVIFSNNSSDIPQKFIQYVQPKPACFNDLLQEAAIPVISNAHKSSFNLLQGNFTVKHQIAGLFYYTKFFASSGLLVLALYIATMWLSAINLNNSNQMLSQQLISLYKFIKPGHNKLPDDFKYTLRKKLKIFTAIAAKRASGEWSILKQISKFISRCRSCKISNIQIANRSLNITLLSQRKEKLLRQQIARLDGVRLEWESKKVGKQYEISMQLSHK